MEDKKFMMPGLPVANISGTYYTAEQMHEYAKCAIELNQKETAKQELRPFDLEAAKRGEPIVTRDGRQAVFVAHDPGAGEGYRVLARVASNKCASAYREDGAVKSFSECEGDLFMAPRVVWLNKVQVGEGGRTLWFEYKTEEEARAHAKTADNIYIVKEIAVRVELD